MNDKLYNNFHIGKAQQIVYVTKAYLFRNLCFMYVVDAFIT